MGASFSIRDLLCLDTLFPAAPECPLCRLTSGGAGRSGICRRCLATMEGSRARLARCNRCGKYVQEEGRCADCRLREPCFLMAWSIGPYEGLLRQCIHDLKYQGFRGVARPLGRLMAERMWAQIPGGSWRNPWGDLRGAVLTPIPLHPEKLYRRNFNQAFLLAEAVSEAAGFPVFDMLARREDRAAQAHLGRQERLRNLQGQFYVKEESIGGLSSTPRSSPTPRPSPFTRPSPSGRPGLSSRLGSASPVIIVDDVYTTGATVQEAAQALRQAGVTRMYVLTAAAGMGL
ncbi:hypothetical protein GTO91_07155 [Heliobacterium undosum]|uniref:Double zinc ribbon domain-containing protein n=1 Tax=Heliomicrobium undosum TaxID=121734 RepID=A0A845KZH1_9FIRM|nr:ComF family protein [Heliomicrobium undosum]MZP29482.1 hypothetical protein [Heliomicrobium undosum]